MGDETDEFGAVSNTRTLIYDVKDLDEPLLVKEFFSENTSSDHNLYIVDDLMFQSNYNSGLRVFDVSDPENPRQVGFFDTVPGPDSPAMSGFLEQLPVLQVRDRGRDVDGRGAVHCEEEGDADFVVHGSPLPRPLVTSGNPPAKPRIRELPHSSRGVDNSEALQPPKRRLYPCGGRGIPSHGGTQRRAKVPAERS